MPGGEAAAERALAAVSDALETRGRCLSVAGCLAAVRARGRVPARFGEPLLGSLLRVDPRFRLRAGVVGLRAWPNVRVPTQRDLLLACLAEGGGRAEVARVLERFEDAHGAPVTPARITQIANGVGATSRAGVIARR